MTVSSAFPASRTLRGTFKLLVRTDEQLSLLLRAQHAVQGEVEAAAASKGVGTKQQLSHAARRYRWLAYVCFIGVLLDSKSS